MPNGSNWYIKQQVQAGTLCYICETATPTLVDDVGGHVCQDCHTHMETKIGEILLERGGYRVRTGKAKQSNAI